MGSLRRPIRRGKARAEKLACLEAARELDLRALEPYVDLDNVPRESYLRFVVRQPRGRWVGLFRADAYPGRAGLLPDAARSRLRSVLRWFNRNMSVPPRPPRNAVCWFRA